MDTPRPNVSTHASQNIEIKSERIDIVEIGEEIFTNAECFDDDSQQLQNVSYNQNIDGVDDQVFIKEEIICKEEPEFYDVVNGQIVPESEMMLTANDEDGEQQMDSAVFKFDDSKAVPSTSSSQVKCSTSNAQITTGNPRTYECYVCKHPNCTIQSLRSHFLRHIGNTLYKCQHCVATFKRKWYYSRHISQEHSKNGEKMRCSYCYRAFNTKTRLANHERIHTGQKPWCCSVCQKRFNTRSSFEWHKKIHTGEKPFKCTECSLRFRLKHHLESHLRTHAKQALHGQQLNLNGANEGGNNLLGQELLSMDPAYENGLSIDVRTYQCYLCGFNGNQNQLKIHMKTNHTAEKLFNCKLCKKIFLRPHSIELHMLTHSQNCEFKCDICGEQFRRKEGLKMHMQAKHSQETAFQCKVCSEKFYKKFTFVTHMRRHTGFKPFKCEFCSKTFVKKSDMVRHTRTHTGERPHQCGLCKMTFTRNHLLTDHKRNIHGV